MAPDEPDQPPLDPADDARVRRLLAEARTTEPMPAEVAERLDQTLAKLAEERALATGVEVPRTQDVAAAAAAATPLEARTRRRHAGALLAAAAAVVVIAVGVGQVVQNNTGDGDAASGGSVDFAERGAADESAPLDAGAGRPEESGDQAVTKGDPARPDATMTTDEPPRRIRPHRLMADLIDLQHASLPHPATASYNARMVTAPADFPCAPAPWGRGVIVGVLYDGMPAMVAFRQPIGESQVAEVLQCGTGDVLRSTTLPAE